MSWTYSRGPESNPALVSEIMRVLAAYGFQEHRRFPHLLYRGAAVRFVFKSKFYAVYRFQVWDGERWASVSGASLRILRRSGDAEKRFMSDLRLGLDSCAREEKEKERKKGSGKNRLRPILVGSLSLSLASV